MKFFLQVFMIIFVFNMATMKKTSVYKKNIPEEQPRFSVLSFDISHKPDFFGMRREVEIKAKVKLHEEGWRLAGYQQLAGSRKITTDEVKNSQKDFAMVDISDLYVSIIQIIPVFEKSKKAQNREIDLNISLTTGGPVGPNLYEVSLKDKKEFIYWYEDK